MFISPSFYVGGQTTTEIEDEVEITTMETDWKSGITGADLSVVDSEDGIRQQWIS